MSIKEKNYRERTKLLIWLAHNAKIGFHAKKHEDYLRKIEAREDLEDYLQWLESEEEHG